MEIIALTSFIEESRVIAAIEAGAASRTQAALLAAEFGIPDR